MIRTDSEILKPIKGQKSRSHDSCFSKALPLKVYQLCNNSALNISKDGQAFLLREDWSEDWRVNFQSLTNQLAHEHHLALLRPHAQSASLRLVWFAEGSFTPF